MSTIVEIHRMLTDGAVSIHTKQSKHGSMLDMFKVQVKANRQWQYSDCESGEIRYLRRISCCVCYRL